MVIFNHIIPIAIVGIKIYNNGNIRLKAKEKGKDLMFSKASGTQQQLPGFLISHGTGESVMCELFGLSGKKREDISGELREFFSHSSQNPDGWGLALYNGEEKFFHKENMSADQSAYVRNLLKHPVTARDAIAHIRLATIGYDEYENTHPFRCYDSSGREWTLAHNGTIFEGDILNSYYYVQQGETDSERILLYIIDCLNTAARERGHAPDEKERFDILADAAAELSPQNKLNLLIYDGEVLYVHTNYRDSLFERDDGSKVLFSTKPLSGGVWEKVPFTRLSAYKNGKRIRVGRDHGNEYFPDEASINALMLTYSGL